MTSTHLFFNSVFTETHPSLVGLEESFANLRIGYMPNSIINKNEEIVNETEVEGSYGEENDSETETLPKE